MKNINIVNADRDFLGLVGFGFEIHYLITDKDKSYVVEFNNTKPDGEKLIVLENETIMTNFYNHLSDTEKGIYSDNASGMERYKKLEDNRDTVTSIETMKELMQSIRYSNSYRTDGEYDPGENYDNPYTCLSDHQTFGEDPINYASMKEHIPEIIEKMKDEYAEVKKILEDPELKNPNYLWVTSHSSVYDLENLTLSVAVYERFDKYYDYSLK